MLVTPGDGRDHIAAIVRLCAQLRGIVAGNFVYELSDVALWGAASRGLTADKIVSALEPVASTTIPSVVVQTIAEFVGRFGALRLEQSESGAQLVSRDPAAPVESILDGVIEKRDDVIPHPDIARIKLAAATAGWPVLDDRRVEVGSPLAIELNQHVKLRAYQRAAVRQFLNSGSGLVMLPCGAGKTVVGVAAAASIGQNTLVLTPSRSVGEQWRRAFHDLTSVARGDVGLSTGNGSPSPVTICTYHGATSRSRSGDLIDYPWGLVVYDEVQSLPASTFRLAAAFQSKRRLGLTATLVREDGREGEIFALVGPPIFDLPWIELERDGWIAPAICTEIRLPEPPTASDLVRYKLAALRRLIRKHATDQVLVVSSDLDLLRSAARTLNLPMITGRSTVDQRADRYRAFNAGEINVLALSKVGSVGIDLPGASVMVQLSGTYGSRQEEAQRLGRLLRPGDGKQAHFYTLVAAGTREVEFARRRQRYLVVQGYQYQIVDAADLPKPAAGG